MLKYYSKYLYFGACSIIDFFLCLFFLHFEFYNLSYKCYIIGHMTVQGHHVNLHRVEDEHFQLICKTWYIMACLKNIKYLQFYKFSGGCCILSL